MGANTCCRVLLSNNEIYIDNAISIQDKKVLTKGNTRTFIIPESNASSMNGDLSIKNLFSESQLKIEKNIKNRKWSRCTTSKKKTFNENEMDELIINHNTKREEIKTRRRSSLIPNCPQFLNLRVTPSHFRIEIPGKLADQYQILDIIGGGAYGEVRKVCNKITKEIRAVKIIAKSECQTTSNFSDEISILQKLVIKDIRIGSSECCKAVWFL